MQEKNDILASPGAAPREADLMEDVRRLVRHGQKRRAACVLLESVGVEIAGSLAFLWLIFWVDNLFHLPVSGRLLANLAFVVLVLSLTIRALARWRKGHYTEDQAALAIGALGALGGVIV